MNTLNETGRHAAASSTARTRPSRTAPSCGPISARGSRASSSARRLDRMDGIDVYALRRRCSLPRRCVPKPVPRLPDACSAAGIGGLLYEVDPRTGATVARRHSARERRRDTLRPPRECLRHLETAPTTMVGTPPRPRPGGYIFKFTPDRRGDLSSGQLYALKIVNDRGDRTGERSGCPGPRTGAD